MSETVEPEDIVSRDVEEAAKLVKEVQSAASDVSKIVKELLARVKQPDFNTEKGISLLDVKCHVFLEYLINLVYISFRKICGKKIENDPAIERIVEARVVLEKIKPIEQRLSYQIQKLITIANTGHVSANDPLHFKPNPDNLISQDDDDDEEKDESDADESSKIAAKSQKSNVYVPPKISAAYYDGDETEQSRQQKLLENAKKRALSSSVLQELKKEYDMGPEEIKESSDIRRQKVNRELKERSKYEEEYFTRLPLTKKQKNEMKTVNTMSTLSNLAQFGDISALDVEPDAMGLESRRRSSKKFSSMKLKGKKKGFKRKRH